MHDQSKQDRAFRERLERRAVPDSRLDIVSSLNKMSAGDDLQRSAIDILMAIRKAPQGRRRTVGELNARHDLLHKAGVFERLDRGSAPLTKATTQDRSDPGPDPAFRERFTAPLKAERVKDSDGDVLSVETMAKLAAARALASRYF